MQDGPNPTADYYLSSRFRADGPEIRVADLRDPGTIATTDFAETLVLFCRYCSASWLRRCDRAPVAGVAMLIDDDMAALCRDPAVPLRYRWKLWRRSVAYWPRVSDSLGCLLASTPVLAERLGPDARVLPPLADAIDLTPPPPPRPMTLAFHATAVHRPEHAWLAPVVRGLLATVPELIVEIVADRRTRRLWTGDPRITIVPQRGWRDYRAATQGVNPGLLLAPLLPNAGNAARAPVKRIDAGRSGAALIVSDPSLYDVTRAEAELGMAWPLDPGSWISGLTGLLGDPDRRDRLARLNRERLVADRAAASPLFVPAARPGYWQFAPLANRLSAPAFEKALDP